MPAVVGKPDPGDELRVPYHGGHALARVVVVDGERLVGARGGRVLTRPVQRHLDEGAVVAGGPLERPVIRGEGDE